MDFAFGVNISVYASYDNQPLNVTFRNTT